MNAEVVGHECGGSGGHQAKKNDDGDIALRHRKSGPGEYQERYTGT